MRIAIVQLELHPALATRTVSYLSEPTLPVPGAPSLSALGMQGIPVVDLQNGIREKYVAWERRRLNSVLSHIAKLNPVPDIVLFPEGALAEGLLPVVAEWSTSHQNTVVAGSHTPNLGSRGKSRYQRLGELPQHLTELSKYETDNCVALFRRGILTLAPKSVSSVYERSDLGLPTGAVPQPRNISIETNAGKLQLLVLNCAEALKNNVEDGADLVAIVAFHRKPVDFAEFAKREVAQKHIVAVANAGQYGGSNLYTAVDGRAANWLSEVFQSGLPPGNAIFVADVDLDVRTVEVSVSQPAQAISLVELSEVVGQLSKDAEGSKSLARAAELHTDPDRMQAELAKVPLNTSVIRRRRVDLLAANARSGAVKESICRQVGFDCVVPAVGSLSDLEGDLSAACAAPLQKIMMTESHRFSAEVLRQVVTFYGAVAQHASERSDQRLGGPEIAEEREILDRVDEIKRIDDFLKKGGSHVLTITGAPSIGKTAAWRKALRSLGIHDFRTVTLNENPSPEFLVASAAGLKVGDAGITFPTDWCRRELAAYLRTVPVLVLQNAHNLLEYGRWKDPDLAEAFHEMIEIAASIGVRVILESRRRTPADDDPFLESAERMKIGGLDGRNAVFGVQMLDGQLRRVDLSPEILTQQQKETVVARLSGHPKALELAANVCLDEGTDELLKGLESGKSSLFARIGRLAKLVAIDRLEAQVLGLACQARSFVPRSSITAATSSPSATAIRDLTDTGFLELDNRGWVRIPEVFHPVFRTLRPNGALVQKFHLAAAQQLGQFVEQHPDEIAVAVEANFHAGMGGAEPVVAVPLPDAAVGVVEALYNEQQWEKAYHTVSAILAHRRDKQVLRLGALIAARMQRLEEAVALARECFDKDNRDFKLLSELGRIALTQRHDRLADELASIADAAGVEDAEVHILRGRLALRKGHLTQAVGFFERATKLTRHNPWAFLHLGKAYMRLGQIDHALDALHDGEQFFYEVHSRSTNALQAIKANIGLCYLQKDEVELAKTYIEGIDSDDRSPETVVAVAALAARRDKKFGPESALELLRNAKVRNQFSRSLCHIMAGQVLLSMGEPQRATAEFEKALEIDHGNVRAGTCQRH
ncbi:MAG TPA: hypothetical protein VG944_23270 [Fimbriimonas sp.]|nr:hypothetical protein [Fimbriimonas sp.]